MVTLTQSANDKIRELIGQQSAPVAGVRVFVQPSGGCSGFAYGMSFADKVEEGDWVGSFGEVTILVDPESAGLLNGVNIDYVETVQASGFKIHNPNAVRTCGCGQSFDTEESAAQGHGHEHGHEHGQGHGHHSEEHKA